jgi:hypothetical protein
METCAPYFSEYEVDIEWTHENIGFAFTANRHPILLVPENEIDYLLITGSDLGESWKDDGEVIPSAAETAEYCPSIFRKRYSGILSYSNALAHLSVEVQIGSGFMDYTDENGR